MNVKHIVVGWHRGGLGYAGQFLNLCGLNVGYSFGADTTRKNLEAKLSQAKEIEISPWLVPFLNHPLLKDIPVTFVLRDPMRVFNSLKHFGHFEAANVTELERFVCQHIPNFVSQYKGKPFQAPVAYLTHWLNTAKLLATDFKSIHVEDFPYVGRSHFKSNRSNVPFLPPTVNSSDTSYPYTPRHLPDNVRTVMLDLLVKAGYMAKLPVPYNGQPHFINTDWHR